MIGYSIQDARPTLLLPRKRRATVSLGFLEAVLVCYFSADLLRYKSDEGSQWPNRESASTTRQAMSG